MGNVIAEIAYQKWKTKMLFFTAALLLGMPAGYWWVARAPLACAQGQRPDLKASDECWERWERQRADKLEANFNSCLRDLANARACRKDEDVRVEFDIDSFGQIWPGACSNFNGPKPIGCTR